MAEEADRISLPWGKTDTIEFQVPQGWNIKDILQPQSPPEIPEMQAELDKAMNNPVGLPRLKEFARRGKTACVVIDDRTRPTPVSMLIPRVIQELNQAGVKDEDITILIALGTHRFMTEDEIAERIGPDIPGRIRIVNHDYMNKSEIVSVGKTPTHGVPVTFNRLVKEADTVVSIGCIESHEQAGVGGGHKNLMPGVAGPEPIHFTHNASFQKPERISSSGMPRERCRFRQAVDECGGLLGDKVFIVNTVLEPIRTVAIVAGDPIKAHAEGRKIFESMAAVSLPERAEVVIADAHPLDLDLRTSMKACFNASAALARGGLFITISRAPEGLGDLRLPASLPPGARAIIKKAPLKALELLSSRINTSPDQAAGSVSLMKILKAADAWLYLTSDTSGVKALQSMGIEFFTDLNSLAERAKEIKPNAEAVVLPKAGASFIAWD
jgi:nickel-dependent lactate racemase